MQTSIRIAALLSLLFSGAIFGFFYAWVCSTMWGLDAAEPRVAIAAMQAMNASVRNIVFAPAFFGTPIVLLITAALAWFGAQRPAALIFAAAGVVYFAFGLMLTATVNVPMNEALAEVVLPLETGEAAEIWQTYSTRWQVWNQARTVASGMTLLLAGIAVMLLKPPRAHGH
ncbi:MAG: anthrone oxygenase family protein [Pseudomonadota bacterium]